jgi:hypothetical protein
VAFTPPPEVTYGLPRSGPTYLAFRDAIDDLARSAGGPIARFAAKRLEYRPTDETDPEGEDPT